MFMSMGNERSCLIVLLAILVVKQCYISSLANQRQSYVVYLGGRDQREVEHDLVVSSHHEILSAVLGSHAAAKESIFYSYTHAFNGFAALLEPEHATAISEMPGVVSVFPNRAHTLQTTRSWSFLGLENVNSGDIPVESLWRKANLGSDVIIGNLDTGVWPESASFDDSGILDPVPSRWKGICENGTQFGSHNCNRKLIGARYFMKGYEAVNGPVNESSTGDFVSPRDSDGHGTHTLSTAGGGFVKGANVFGFAEGIAKGGAPNARVAAYKVCWPRSAVGAGGCYDVDILAAFDAAIRDGVDVLSVSLSASLRHYFNDSIAIGAFHAMQRGKVVVCSAGNGGPSRGSVRNVAPWILTVAASSIDRQFPSQVLLGNNTIYRGQSLSGYHLPQPGFYPLVYSLDAKATNASQTASQFCFRNNLDPVKVRGRIVACLNGNTPPVQKGEAVLMAGGVGMILCNTPGDENVVFPALPHVLPASQLNAYDAAGILHYISTTVAPTAYISQPRTQFNVPAPVMAPFSSQGPNALTLDILKPDITAPGLNILAAFTNALSPTGLSSDDRRVEFNILSGTSMSCPHVAGVVALLKALHPFWSPAAIKSAIMTTATRIDNTNNGIRDSSLMREAGPFNYGSGHVNPNAAADPGLVYDASENDYFLFLCNLRYNSRQMMIITGKTIECPLNPSNVYDLNYPSITISNLAGTKTVNRTVTSVGGSGVYTVQVISPPGVLTRIEPNELRFSEVGEKKSFSVELRVNQTSNGNYVYGLLMWADGKHFVTSPIVVNATLV